MTVRRPGGTAPPSVVWIAGRATQLGPLAEAVCTRYRLEYPDEVGRYGEAGSEWCRHDNQWLLSWAVADVLGVADLGAQVGWLARVLAARQFPLERLARDLEIAAQVVGEDAFGEASSAVADRLLGAAEAVDRLVVGGGVGAERDASEGTPT